MLMLQVLHICKMMQARLHRAQAAAAHMPVACRLQLPKTAFQRSFAALVQHHPSKRRRCSKCCAAAVHPPAAPVNVIDAPRKRLAVFVSGGGSNLKAIHSTVLDGQINAEVAVVVSNAPTCGGCQYAQSQGIPTITFPAPKADPTAGLTAEQLIVALKEVYQVDCVVLAGYLKLIPCDLVRAFKRNILNIHPGLLPSFGGKGYYGQKVHAAVIASGARFSGPTIHFVDEEYDTGPILAQAVVPVYPTDTPQQLAARVLKEEHRLYPQCVAALVDGRITWREDGIPIMWTAH